MRWMITMGLYNTSKRSSKPCYSYGVLHEYDMVVLRIVKSSPDKIILVLLWMRMRGYLTIDHKGRMCIPNILSLGVVWSMSVGFWTGTDCCYGCTESVNIIRYFPNAISNVREVKQVVANSEEDVPKAKDRFFTVKSKGDQEWYPYVPFQYALLCWFMKYFIISYDYVLLC